jgi:AcrR family transcriptional regulator
LRAAAELFYRHGIHATGVAALVEAAHVSTRTFYQHFPTKNALVEAYLHGFESDTPIASEQQLSRADLTASERLLAIFDPLESDDATVLRGCPFHNAAIDAAGEMPHVAQLVKQHKQAFLDRLINTALEAGAPNPVSLGRQLAVVYEGAAALTASSNTTQVVPDARRAAETLIQVALNRP